MLLAARSAFTVRKRLPYDAEVEYIESTGTQYIDTGVAPASTTRCQMRLQVTSVPTPGTKYTWFFGVRDLSSSTSGYGLGSNGSLNIFSQYEARVISNLILTENMTYDIDKNGNVVAINSSIIENTATQFSCSNTLYVFSLNNVGTSYDPITGRLFYLKIYSGQIMKRDFIPVRVDNVGYLYDKVSHQLFGNSGSGNFICGPDVRLLR